MYSYTQEFRLKTADDFSSVFNLRQVYFGQWLKIHYKKNHLAYSRLGLIVSKKNHKRSNRRNYMKRVLRELFRQTQLSWQGYDVIVRVNKYFVAEDYNLVAQEFTRLTQPLQLL